MIWIALSEDREDRRVAIADGTLVVPGPCTRRAIVRDDLRPFTPWDDVSGADSVYEICRYVFDDRVMETASVKFDLTLLGLCPVGPGLPRTRGHYHSMPPGRRTPYFDIYQIHHGYGLVQMHRRSSEAEAVYLATARPGDILFLPPDLCHVVHNLGATPLVFSNWCTRKEHLDYASMQDTCGPAVTVLGIGGEDLTLARNPGFPERPVVFLDPIPSSAIQTMHGARSRLIYDWSEQAEVMGLLNQDDAVDFLTSYYSPARSRYHVRW